MRKFTVTLNERQLWLISRCVEDCSRFMGGQTEMWNTTSLLANCNEIQNKLKLELHPLVTPGLPMNASYGWDGGDCPNKHQRKFIAETYYIYREILHQLTDPSHTWNVYSGETLRCENSGDPIVIEEVKEHFKWYDLEIDRGVDRVAFDEYVQEDSTRPKDWAELLRNCNDIYKRYHGNEVKVTSRKYHGYKMGNCAVSISGDQEYLILCDDGMYRLVAEKQIEWI